jgi:hypothetical protein
MGDLLKIYYLRGSHCARGSSRCPRCKEAEKNGSYALLGQDSNEIDACRQITSFTTEDGKKVHSPFKVVKKFESKEEAVSYGQTNNIFLDLNED